MKELGEHRGHAAEVAGAPGPLEPFRQGPGDLDEAGKVRGVELIGLGGEDEVHPLLFEQAEVPLEVPGVALVVLAGAELQGVDEDRDRHEGVFRPRPAHQGQVPLVEVAHCGHEPDALGGQGAF